MDKLVSRTVGEARSREPTIARQQAPFDGGMLDLVWNGKASRRQW